MYDEQPIETSAVRDPLEVEQAKSMARNVILNLRPKVWNFQPGGKAMAKMT